MKEQTKYIQHDGLKGATHLEVSTYYSKGGANFISGGVMPRGYFVAVKPVTKNGNMTSYVMFSGRRQLLFETARFSVKQFECALAMSGDYEDKLIAAVVSENQSAA